jgi:hypothetical protein
LKYLILAAIIGLLLALLIRRLLPFLRVAQGFIKAIQQIRSGAATSETSFGRKPQSQEKLLRCSVCGTWIPANRAIGGNSQVYCSDRCSTQAGAKGIRRA